MLPLSGFSGIEFSNFPLEADGCDGLDSFDCGLVPRNCDVDVPSEVRDSSPPLAVDPSGPLPIAVFPPELAPLTQGA